MKNTDAGIVRCLDTQGSIVIPIEYRAAMGVNEGDPMSIRLTDDGTVVMRSAFDQMPLCVKCRKPMSVTGAYCQYCGTKRPERKGR